ncbi:MAG TPA: SLBB domain-containing protein [Candidatus Omnitrophota bacterium]|nr:SLBB domain-containing protein [Candidatus Omnitrophota bacterium]
MLKKVLGILSIFIMVLSLLAIMNQGQALETDEKKYVISTNDLLEITVYGEPDLSTTVRVSQDGKITYPFLGNIQVAGLIVRDFEKKITDLLAQDYLVNPQVTIFVKEYAKISILGEIKTPGSYEMKESLNLTQAIALAGGFTDTANTSAIKIIRSSGDRKETIIIDASQVEKDVPEVEIKSNDTIIIEKYGRISIIGQVIRPGVYDFRQDLTVIEAISQAGGFTPTAAQNGTKIIRVEFGRKKVIAVPMGYIMKGEYTTKNILLKEGDTIVVPESFF